MTTSSCYQALEVLLPGASEGRVLGVAKKARDRHWWSRRKEHQRGDGKFLGMENFFAGFGGGDLVKLSLCNSTLDQVLVNTLNLQVDLKKKKGLKRWKKE